MTNTSIFFFEIVKKRIERTQSRLDKIPQQELLLEAAQALRVERERKKELQSQLEDQQQSAQVEVHVRKEKTFEMYTLIALYLYIYNTKHNTRRTQHKTFSNLFFWTYRSLNTDG